MNFRVRELEELFYIMNRIYSENPEEKDDRTVSNSALSMAGILTDSRELYERPKGGQGHMCEALDKIKRKGIEEGIEEGIEAMILDNLEENVKPERIVQKLQKYFGLEENAALQYIEQFRSCSVDVDKSYIE